jgi:hypothetical protein
MLTTQVQNQEKQPYLNNRYPNWEAFLYFVNENYIWKFHSKQKKILKQQLITLMTSYNGLAGTKCLNTQA